jgi:8-oxo-dGTP pyrophosphatase MutT (NUDIX family)
MLAGDMADTLLARLRALTYVDTGTWQAVPAAVLLAMSPVPGADDLRVVLARRPDFMRSHAGQVAFPGGAVEPGDSDGVAAALREAEEEVGLPAARVEVLGSLARVPLAVSGFDVLPVVGLWSGREPLRAHPVEVDQIIQPSLRELADPANHRLVPLTELVTDAARLRALPPGAASPVFDVHGQRVWGFTAVVLIGLLGQLGLPAPDLPLTMRPPER